MKVKRKIIGVVLALSIASGTTPLFAVERAEETTIDAWDGTSDTSWYTGHESETEYHLETAEQLAGLAKLTNQNITEFENKTIYLDKDIDLAGYEWTAIASDSYFKGNFNGQYHSIYNLTDNLNLNEYVGFIGVSDGATIENTYLENVSIAATENTYLAYGTLISFGANTTVKNCYVSGSIEVNTESIIGGLIGLMINDCTVSGCGGCVDVVSTNTEYGSTIGGLIGDIEQVRSSATISDCYYNGSITAKSTDATIGGILGTYPTDYGTVPVSISNCAMFTNDERITVPDNISPQQVAYIGSLSSNFATASNCFWPSSGNYYSVVKLVYDFGEGGLIPDSSFDSSGCGTAVSDFSSNDVLDSLNDNSPNNIKWTRGIKDYPVLEWQQKLIPANYSKVDAAVEKAEKFDKDKNLYKNYNALAAALQAVDRNKSQFEQEIVDDYATAIENAINALEYKDADYSKVDEAISKANALKKDDYKNFSAVESAINAVIRDKNITGQAEVDAMAKAINDAIDSLEKKSDNNPPETKPTTPPPGLNPNPSPTVTDYIISGENTTTAAPTQTTAETAAAAQPVRNELDFLFDDISEETENTYSENIIAPTPAPDSEQTSTLSPTEVGNTNSSDVPPKTGNVSGLSFALGIAALSLIGAGSVRLYNKKRKR